MQEWALHRDATQSLQWVFQEGPKELQRFSSHVFLTDDKGADIKEALGVDKRRSLLYYSYLSLQFCLPLCSVYLVLAEQMSCMLHRERQHIPALFITTLPILITAQAHCKKG